jgi:nucleoside-diphosphate-sugar epimerase
VEYVIITDFGTQYIFNDALKGVNYIFHIASPMPGKASDFKNGYLGPSIQGTTSILEAAAKTPSIKKVVITSSAYALVPVEVVLRGELQDGYLVKGIE